MDISRQTAGGQESVIEPLDEAVDHVRGPATARLIVEYGDYECPYSRQAFRSIERVEAQSSGGVRFAFRHFPLSEIHPHALAASRAAEAAALQDRFWEMHELLFHRQHALEDDDLRRYASELGLDVARFESDRSGEAVLDRVRRDVRSGIASGEVRGTPTLFIDGVAYRGGLDGRARRTTRVRFQCHGCAVGWQRCWWSTSVKLRRCRRG
jgi:protein-disulfide isomerase